MYMYIYIFFFNHFACCFASGHLSLAEVNIFSRFLLRGTQGDRRYMTAHVLGPPAARGRVPHHESLRRIYKIFHSSAQKREQFLTFLSPAQATHVPHTMSNAVHNTGGRERARAAGDGSTICGKDTATLSNVCLGLTTPTAAQRTTRTNRQRHRLQFIPDYSPAYFARGNVITCGLTTEILHI
ncbi:unnamed protein product [Ectocarpus sp. 4 AP-2014]